MSDMLIKENKCLRKALKDLVELQSFAAEHAIKYTPMKFDSLEAKTEYETRKPAAWAYARKVLHTDFSSGEQGID